MLRRFLCIITVFLLTVSIGFAQIVHIPDTNLQQALQEELGITPPFTQEDMMLLTRLYAIEKGIVNIQGLEFTVNLTELDLAGNPVKDITPLQSLMNLTHLGLGSTNISDLSPLSALTSLVDLDLGDNQISDLSPLSALTDLISLSLPDNQISDLSPLSELTSLTKLDLQYNQISDLSPLADLISLRDINLINNPLSDLGPLSNLTNLEVLDLSYGKVSDVSPLAGLENLPVLIMHRALRAVVREELGLSNSVPVTKDNIKQLTRLHATDKGIVNIQGLEFAVNLTELDLVRNPIKDISPLQGLMNLTHLGLGATNISDSDLSPLASLTSLRYLDLGDNQISDLSPLSALTSLRYLNLGDNQISDLSPLSALIDLRYLSLISNPLSDLGPLSNLTNLEELEIAYCKVSDVSPLAGLVNLRVLIMHHNLTRDFTPLSGLKNLTYFDHGGICEIAPLPPPVRERIANRTFPSIALPLHSLVHNTEPVRRLTYWDDPDIYYDVATQHDIHHYSHRFGLGWHPTLTEPTEGLAIRLVGHPEHVMAEYQKYADRNPNMLFLPTIAIGVYGGLDAFPPDSDFWLRDADGQVIKNEVPWDEYTIDILNPEVQQLTIERVVGVAECGYFNGVMFDTWAPYHIGTYGKHFNIGEEEVIEAYITILKGIRARVRDDFLILVNRNRKKSPRYAEWINGSHMETAPDHPGGYTHERLMTIEDALLWNEEHLREPRINILHGEGVYQPIDGPDNLRWMRVFTTLSLTHSDGYCIFKAPVPGEIPDGAHIWYDFWSADLGRPVSGAETKGQLYENREGLFIREFTNGWAVYNRSGQTQDIQLSEEVNGWESGVKNERWHTLPDLDGEIYLKSESELETSPSADVNEDGVVNILDLVLIANAFGEKAPDVNGDGIVNILDLVVVANAFE